MAFVLPVFLSQHLKIEERFFDQIAFPDTKSVPATEDLVDALPNSIRG
jgi:hypothetical protein